VAITFHRILEVSGLSVLSETSYSGDFHSFTEAVKEHALK
jgi:hypothetical protein